MRTLAIIGLAGAATVLTPTAAQAAQLDVVTGGALVFTGAPGEGELARARRLHKRRREPRQDRRVRDRRHHDHLGRPLIWDASTRPSSSPRTTTSDRLQQSESQVRCSDPRVDIASWRPAATATTTSKFLNSNKYADDVPFLVRCDSRRRGRQGPASRAPRVQTCSGGGGGRRRRGVGTATTSSVLAGGNHGLTGYAGNDTLNGGEGDDTLDGSLACTTPLQTWPALTLTSAVPARTICPTS